MASQRPKQEPVPKAASSAAGFKSHEPAPSVEDTVGPFAGQAKVKADRKTLTPRSLLQMQRLAGNRAATRLASPRPALQRHTSDGAPGAPPPLEEEVILQGMWGDHTTALPVQRWDKGAAKGAKVARGAKGGPTVGAKRINLGSVGFSAKDLKADGASTLNATLAKGAGRKVTWGVIGPPGTTIDAAGVVKAGADAGGADFAKVQVTATDDEVPTAKAQGTFTLWSSPAWQAKIDVAELWKSGPLVKKGYKASFNGTYDATWTPKKRRLLIEVPIVFDFPDDPISRRMSAAAKEKARKRMAGFRWSFISNVQKQWGGQFTFSMVREPTAFWSKLGPVGVKVRVFEPKTKASAYYTVHYKSRTTGRAGVSFPDVDLFRGDLNPQRAFRKETLAGEKKQLQNISPPVNVDAKGQLDAASLTSVKFLADYIKRLKQPPVRLALTGKAPKKSQGVANAQAVRSKLHGFGVKSPHAITVGGAADPLDNQVHIAPRVSSTYINFTDVSAHEFGHMIGLPDEYPEDARKIGDNLRTHARLVAAFGQAYADQVGKVTPSTASIMQGGDQVRVQHYIHFWDTQILVSNLHATAPLTKFGDADWKLNG